MNAEIRERIEIELTDEGLAAALLSHGDEIAMALAERDAETMQASDAAFNAEFEAYPIDLQALTVNAAAREAYEEELRQSNIERNG